MLNLIVVEPYRGRICFLSSVTLSYLRVWVCQSLRNSVRLNCITVVFVDPELIQSGKSVIHNESEETTFLLENYLWKTCHWCKKHYDVGYKAPSTPVKKKLQLHVSFIHGVPKQTMSWKEPRTLMKMFSINIKSSSRSVKTKRTSSSSTIPGFLVAGFPFGCHTLIPETLCKSDFTISTGEG